MNKIALFGFYFGNLPMHIRLWFRTCGYNPEIDFIFVTDQEIDYPLPDNVKLVKTDIHTLTDFFSERLGLTANLYRPYKLCDFRPAYGVIYEEMLKGYDFWGHCDQDLVFGDIRALLTEEILDAHDKIQPFGHLCLYRNNELMNNLYKEQCEGVADYRDVFTESNHYAFDEFRGIDKICEIKGIKKFKSEDIFVETWIFKSRLADKNSGVEDGVFFWENGKLFMAWMQDGGIARKEIMYMHLRNRPMKMPSFDILSADAFFVVANGFKPKVAGVLTEKDMRTMNKPAFLYGEKKLLWWKYQKKIYGPTRRLYRRIKKKFKRAPK